MKKYLVVLLPLITSCSKLGNVNNMNNGEDISHLNSRIDSKQSHNIRPIFKKGLRLSAVIGLLQEFKNFIASHEKIFSTYDSELKYISDLIEPYKDSITKYHLAAAATLNFKSFGEALCIKGSKVYGEVIRTKGINLLNNMIHLVYDTGNTCKSVTLYDILLRYGKIDYVKMLLKYGANANHLLFSATYNKNLEWVKSLIEDKEIDVDINYTSFGRNILEWAIFNFREDLFDYLWDKGAIIVGQHPIHVVVKNHNAKPETVNTIIDKFSKEVDVRNDDGQTALHCVAGITNSYIFTSDNLSFSVNKLVDSGADIYAKDYNGYTALDIAKKCNNEKVLKLLKEKLSEKVNNAHISNNEKIFS